MNLQITTRIDQYLTGEMSSVEKANFETELSTNSQLKQEVDLQSLTMEGIKMSAQRQMIKKTANTYRFHKTLKWLAVGGAIALLASSILYYVLSAQSSEDSRLDRDGSDSSGLIEMPTDTVGTADSSFVKTIEQGGLPYEGIPAQYFTIPTKGGVVLSDEGVLLSIPENAFLKNNVAYSGPVVLQFQEALKGSDIIKGGLNTASGNDLLETRGMISLTAYTPEQEILEVNPQVGVYVQMPVSNLNSDMMLFVEVLSGDGSEIDWQNPEALEKIPVPVDMALLNFYPPYYESKLDDLKWKKDKHSRDSLYMSFENWGENYSSTNILTDALEVTVPPSSINIIENPINPKVSIADTFYTINASSNTSFAKANMLKPSKVMAFWNSQFNNTILATREFEKRMKVIHELCQPEILSIYVNDINRPMYQMDKDAAKAVSSNMRSTFEAFASERVGSIAVNNPHLEQLVKFYSSSVKALSEAQKKIFEEERARQQKWDIGISNERMRERLRTQQQNAQTYNDELQLNMENVYRQLGLTASFTIRGGAGGRRIGTIMKNVDAFVRSATRSRVTATYVDNTTGKKATLKYNEFSFEVPEAGKYKKLFAYLLPNKFQSYQRLNVINGKLAYNLNDEMMYDLVVLGLTETGFEYFEKQKINKGHLGIVKMEVITETVFNERISKLDNKRESQLKNMSDEFAWLVKEHANYEVQKQRKEMAAFRREVAGVVFPCDSGIAVKEGEGVFNEAK